MIIMFGRNIKKYRLLKGLSMREMAKKMDEETEKTKKIVDMSKIVVD